MTFNTDYTSSKALKTPCYVMFSNEFKLNNRVGSRISISVAKD